MATKKFGERMGAVVINGRHIRNYCERDTQTWAEGSAGESHFETNAEWQGMPEAGGVLQYQHAGR